MKTLVAGIGNPILSDDGLGVHAAKCLRQRRLPDDVDVVVLGTAGLDLLQWAVGYDRLIVIDAIAGGDEPPGTILELEGRQVSRALHATSSHEADLPASLELGRRLLGPEMPDEIKVIAVVAADIRTFSEDLTPPVAAALPRLVERVMQLVSPLF